MPRIAVILCFFCGYFMPLHSWAQPPLQSYAFREDVTLSIDFPASFHPGKPTRLVLYALPNGNTTAQTYGKKMAEGDDWHFDIQHIGAQTRYVRERLPEENLVVVYLENALKSWPAWKRKHANYRVQIQAIVDTLLTLLPGQAASVHLNGHSGGGAFIFGYLDGVGTVPSRIQSISFIDSNYGYDSSYAGGLIRWLQQDRARRLTVLAYNDSIALYNGKPLVSATGGTWYKSRRMIADLGQQFIFTCRGDSLIHCRSASGQVQFLLKQNPERAIWHTQQVALNGFIHTLLIGTPAESQQYHYLGEPVYRHLIR